MEEQFNTKKISIEDLIDNTQHNNISFSYKIENNQQKYSHKQKCKP